MCGIFGALRSGNDLSIVDEVIRGLEQLEYRGYDSAGIAIIKPAPDNTGRALERVRSTGPISSLRSKVSGFYSTGSNSAVGHTRWATHGEVSDVNAHPHYDCTGTLAVAHNGATGNSLALRQTVIESNHVLTSETDTELIAHLLEEELANADRTHELVAAALRTVLDKLSGSHAVAVLVCEKTEYLVVGRKGNAGSLYVGKASSACYVSSDIGAFPDYVTHWIAVPAGMTAVLTVNGPEAWTGSASSQSGEWLPVDRLDQGPRADLAAANIFLSEIYQQPAALKHSIGDRVGLLASGGGFELMDVVSTSKPVEVAIRQKTRKIVLLGSGTPYFAAIYGAALLERLTGLSARAQFAHEFDLIATEALGQDTLVIVVSQSGETADALLALDVAKHIGAMVIAITNVAQSSLAQRADAVLLMRCGPEFSVAQSKAFTAELACLAMLAWALTNMLSSADRCRNAAASLGPSLRQIANQVDSTLTQLEGERIAEFSRIIAKKRALLVIGRGLLYPIALEGALKVRELCSIPADGLPAGELKHGPIAVIEPGYPVVALCSVERTREATMLQVAQLRARGAIVGGIVAQDDLGQQGLDLALRVEPSSEVISPILGIVPLQLLANHVALLLGLDVDRPRNLAKSVTVP